MGDDGEWGVGGVRGEERENMFEEGRGKEEKVKEVSDTISISSTG